MQKPGTGVCKEANVSGGKYAGEVGGDGHRDKVLYRGSGPNPESQGGLTIKDTPSGVGSRAEAGSPVWRPVQQSAKPNNEAKPFSAGRP